MVTLLLVLVPLALIALFVGAAAFLTLGNFITGAPNQRRIATATQWESENEGWLNQLADNISEQYAVKPCRKCNEKAFYLRSASPTGQSVDLVCVSCGTKMTCRSLTADVADVNDSIRRYIAGRSDLAFDQGMYLRPAHRDTRVRVIASTKMTRALGTDRISDDVRRFVWKRDQGRCVACGATADLQYDHLIPRSKGGNGSAENIQLLCGPCNRQKSVAI